MADRTLRTRRFLALVAQVASSEGSERAAMRKLGCDQSYASQLRKNPHRDVGAKVLERARQRLKLRPEFFADPALGDAPNYLEYVGVDDSRIEYEHKDTKAWLELVSSGELDDYRKKGLAEGQIQQVRRAQWHGVPRPRDYRRLLDAYLLGPGMEPEAAREAREKVEERGGPSLKKFR